MQLPISPKIEFNANDFTNDVVLDEQLESASDDGSDAYPGDTYHPINVNDYVVDEM